MCCCVCAAYGKQYTLHAVNFLSIWTIMGNSADTQIDIDKANICLSLLLFFVSGL